MKSYPTISEDASIQTEYERMRRDGQSHNIAEMLATQITPFLMTDSVWNEGRCNGNDFAATSQSRRTGDEYKKIAARAGVSVTGKTYLPSLARFPGDPEAWVSDRGDVDRVIRKRPGWKKRNNDGAVTVAGPDAPPPVEIDVAESIVAEEVGKELAKNPERRVGDVREKVKNRLRPHWKKKKE